MTKAAERICDVLIEAGIDHVFGIPGGGTIPIWDALFDKQDKIRVVLARHEQAAACMADMYGKLTGKPAVLMGQGAFIASSGAFGIMEAFMSSSPMLILTDTSDMGFSQLSPYQDGTGEYGSVDLRDIFRSMCKFTSYAVTPEEAVQGVQFAIKHSITGRPGPACVLMRQKAISSEIDPNRIPRIFNTKSYLNLSGTIAPQNEIDRAADMILEAKFPVIIAGNGVHLSKSYQELRELAELLGAPVATSYKGQSAIEGIHPLAVGMMGTFGQKAALSSISDADVLLVAGCHMSPSDTRYDNPQFIDPGRQKIIQLDIDPRNSGWNFPVDVSLNGDLNLVLEQILKSLRGKVPPSFSASRTKEIEDRKQRDGFCEAPELYSDASPILPQRIVKEIENAVDPSTIITLDAGNNRLWVSNLFKSKAPGSLFVPGGVAGMAWGPPAALAVKLVYPDRPVLSISGDGGFAMMFHVLSTAVQYQLPVTFVVMNNSMLGMVNNLQSMKQRIIATVFAETDFAQIAKAFGCNGIKVTDPGVLGETIKKSLHASLPTVIDVATDPNESFFKIAQLEDFLRVI